MVFRDDKNSRLPRREPQIADGHESPATRKRFCGHPRSGPDQALRGNSRRRQPRPGNPPGQFFGLLGPNGSGKTTTIHMLATLVRPTAGAAQVAGYDVGREAVKARESIGLVFQESALDRTLTVAENLRFAGLLLDLPPKVIAERSGELLELFGLQEQRAKPVATLSGGMRRALDIVRGVIHQPRILFLDEPTIGLDLPNVAASGASSNDCARTPA